METNQAIAYVEQGFTLLDMLLCSSWSGIISLGVLFFYSIPMGIMGIRNLEKRSLFILRADDICKLLTALFLMVTGLGFVEQFSPSSGMDDRSLHYDQFITTISSSAFFVFFAIVITRFIKILLMKNKKDSNQRLHSIARKLAQREA